MKKRPLSKRGPTQRLASEREVWQGVRRRGKRSFIARCTLSIGGLLFLFAGLAQRLLGNSHLQLRQILGAALLCATLGFLCGSLLWQRGEAIVNAPSR